MYRDLQEAFHVDISSYSLRFEQCQGIKVPHVDKEDESGSVQRYAVFRLCPRHDCSSCDEDFGEYVLELTEYLQYLSHYIHETKGALCETCDHCQVTEEKSTAESKLEDFNSNCQYCSAECEMLDKLEASGYIDATEFTGCSLIYSGPDDGKNYYAGPVCSRGGEAISIGVFRDSYCSSRDASKDIRDFLVDTDGKHQAIAYSFMKLTYSETCFSCMEDQVEGLHDLRNDQNDKDSVKNFCEVLYDSAHKCEAEHGFALANLERDGAVDEEMETCELIKKMKSHRQHTRNGDQGEQFIENDTAKDEERNILDMQTVSIVVLGLASFFLLFICRVCCSTDVSYTAMSNDMQTHEDDPVTKYSDEHGDATEEESSSSFLEELDVVDHPDHVEN
eukprot:scaffold1667_cov173-Amphora_coffeaeformis.AAC.1